MESVSILITIYNTKIEYFKDCLDSIQSQTTKLDIELVIVDDGSSNNYYSQYLKLLKILEEKNSNIKVLYHKLEKNMGVGYASNIGIELCNNELIYRMDSDDIMSPTRIKQQYDFMINNPDYKLCGGDILSFKRDNIKVNYYEKTNHPEIVTYNFFVNEFKKSGRYYFINHPTFCIRKSAVLEIGNYNKDYKSGIDIDITIRILKKYGKIYNIKSLPVMLLYRQHENNITKKETHEKVIIYKNRISKIINEK